MIGWPYKLAEPRDTYICRLIGSALSPACRQLGAKSLPIFTGFQLDHKKQTTIKIESELIIFFQEKKWNCLLWHVDHLAQTPIYWKRCHNESLNFILLVWIQDRVTRRSIIIIIDVESLGRKVGNVYVSVWKSYVFILQTEFKSRCTTPNDFRTNIINVITLPWTRIESNGFHKTPWNELTII